MLLVIARGVFMNNKKEIGKSTKRIWSGVKEYERYEQSTQVPVVQSDTFR